VQRRLFPSIIEDTSTSIFTNLGEVYAGDELEVEYSISNKVEGNSEGNVFTNL